MHDGAAAALQAPYAIPHRKLDAYGTNSPVKQHAHLLPDKLRYAGAVHRQSYSQSVQSVSLVARPGGKAA